MNGIFRFGCAALAVALLAGCTSDFYDSRMRGYVPQMPEERYPIEVVKGAVKVRIPVVSGKLSMKEREMVQHVAQAAVSINAPVYVIRPPRSVKAEVMAAEVTNELIRMGIIPSRIRHRANGKPGEVVIYYRRKFAVTKECGDWSNPLTETAFNEVYPNYGCAQQHNLAAMVDNPADFERPRVLSGVDSDNRNAAIHAYRKRKDTTSKWPGGAKTSITTSVSSLAR